MLEHLRAHRCPRCPELSFEGPVWRLHLAEHLHREHRGLVRGEIRDWCEDAFEGVELRATQRAILLFALDAGSFTVEEGRDSQSLHSMKKRGWFAALDRGGMREREWTLTDLGRAVARGALERARKLGERVRRPVLPLALLAKPLGAQARAQA